MQHPDCIWFVDDNDADNFFHSHIVKKTGITDNIVCYQSANEALAALRRAQQNHDAVPELIFLDINMPGMNGWEFLDALDPAESTPGRPILFMLSTSLNPDDQERSLDHVAVTGYLSKPLSSASLLEIVNKHF